MLYVLCEAVIRKNSHLLITGDFNYPKIDWTTWSIPRDDNSIGKVITVCCDSSSNAILLIRIADS